MKKVSAILLATAVAIPAVSVAPAFAHDKRVPTYVGEASKTQLFRGILKRLHEKNERRRASDTRERLLMWHDIALDSVAITHTPVNENGNPASTFGDQIGPGRTSRALAIVEVAVFDAVNAFDRKYDGYKYNGRAQGNASMDAAIAQAAHDALVVLYPTQKSQLDRLLSTDLGQIKANRRAIDNGREVGAAAAKAILDARFAPNRVANDGAQFPDVNFGAGGAVATGSANYFGDSVNGGVIANFQWQPDPLTPAADGSGTPEQLSIGAYHGAVKTFVLNAGNQFRLPPPPAQDSAEFVAGYNEVRALGGSPDNVNSPSTSTPATRFIGNYWGYDAAPLLGTPPRLYNQIAVKLANQNGIRDVVKLARYLALTNLAHADSGIAAWDSKWYYNYARPVTGIAEGPAAANAATPADPTWQPVGVSVINTTLPIRATPPFPAYPSGHATFGASTFEVARAFFGNNTAFTFVSDEYNGEGSDPLNNNQPRPLVPVRFRTLQQAQESNGISRIYNGVHWQWDNIGGQALGVQIGQWVLNHALQRKDD